MAENAEGTGNEAEEKSKMAAVDVVDEGAKSPDSHVLPLLAAAKNFAVRSAASRAIR